MNARLNSFIALAVFFIAFIPPSAAFGQDEPAGMRSALASDQDFFARLAVRIERAPGVSPETITEYLFFRSDGKAASLLYQIAPRSWTGVAFLMKSAVIMAFNPACFCASITDDAAAGRRLGFRLAEINPLLVLERLRPADAAETSAAGQPAYLFEESGADGRRLWHVSAQSHLPLRLEYRNGRGEPERIVTYLSYFEIDKKYFPRLVRIVDGDGRILLLEMSGVSHHPLPDFIFTQAYLEELAW